MADAIAVQRGTVYTHGMHIYPGDSPTGVWASIEAQNAGLVAGMWQNHMLCSPNSEILEVEQGAPVWVEKRLNIWRFPWPQLGSYSRLDFWLNASTGWDGWNLFNVYLRMWDPGYTAPFHTATYTKSFELGQTRRVTFEWDMETATLAPHLDEAIFLEIVGRKTEYAGYHSWTVRMNQFLLITANLPL